MGSFCCALKALLSVGEHIELKRELAEIINLNTDHAIKVELKSLQSNDKETRKRLDTGSFERVHLLVTFSAKIGIISLQHIALYKGFQPFVNISFVLNRDSDREIRLTSLVLMGTSFANHLTGKFSSEVRLNCLFLRSALDGCFKSIHEQTEELFCVHLLQDIGGLTFPVFEGMTKSFGVDVLLFSLEESEENALKLIEHILVGWLVIMVWIINFKNISSESWHVEKLLEEGYHIADAAKIFQPSIAR